MHHVEGWLRGSGQDHRRASREEGEEGSQRGQVEEGRDQVLLDGEGGSLCATRRQSRQRVEHLPDDGEQGGHLLVLRCEAPASGTRSLGAVHGLGAVAPARERHERVGRAALAVALRCREAHAGRRHPALRAGDPEHRANLEDDAVRQASQLVRCPGESRGVSLFKGMSPYQPRSI